MSFARYPKYKDSGVEWLGAVPEHWHVRKVRWICEIRKRIAGELGYDVLSITQQGLKVKDLEGNDGQLSMDYSKYQLVEVGDFAMNHMDLLTGYVDISGARGVTSPDYRVFAIRDPANCHDKYLLYLFQMGYKNKIFFAYGQGSSQLGRWRLPTEQFNDLPFPLPPKFEQQGIAAFLDRETTKIDELVAEQRRLLKLLKEKRLATISCAITKGLNSSVSVKPSGIEWLGDVPVHWAVAPVACRYDVQLGKMLDSTKITGEHLRPYLRVFDVQWGSINTQDLPEMDFDQGARLKFQLKPGDLLVNEGGSYPGRSAIWLGVIEECYFQKALHRLRALRPEADTTRFFFYVMSWAANQGVFIAGGNETTIEHLPAEKLRSYRFAFPPMNEQAEIATFLDTELAKLDALVDEAERAIDLLQERRTALISAAVTGQIDVRGEAAGSLIPLKPYARGFARQLLAAEILSHCHHYPTTGRVKLQKLIHLCEHVAEIEEVDADYFRKAAGPFDSKLMFGIAAGLSRQRWFSEVKKGERTFYKPLEKAGEHAKYLARWQSKMPKVRKVLELLGHADTQQCEIVSTLYAAWNDLLIEKRRPSDAEIIHEASHPERWHESKLNIQAEKWPVALNWMKEKGLNPSGFGTHTKRELVPKESA